jgi:hypothetical protein
MTSHTNISCLSPKKPELLVRLNSRELEIFCKAESVFIFGSDESDQKNADSVLDSNL